jgi:hypothetical protein
VAAEVAEVETRLALGVMMVAAVDAAMIPHYFYREASNGMAVAAAASTSAMMSLPAALTWLLLGRWSRLMEWEGNNCNCI